ncbi:MAG: hypothetical protein HN348_29765 [Proteobacteria bacterium]|nr:hypothetical protein [Pseudomonadota bacterium]
MIGTTEGYEAGYSLAGGDLDGDGYDDLVVGARLSYSETGAVFVFLAGTCD